MAFSLEWYDEAPRWSPEPWLKTLEILLRPDDFRWVEAHARAVAQRPWRRARRRAVTECCQELWSRSQAMFREWTAVSAQRSDFAGVDPHLVRMRIAWALLGVSVLATWRITLGLPAPASLVTWVAAGTRRAMEPLALAA